MVISSKVDMKYCPGSLKSDTGGTVIMGENRKLTLSFLVGLRIRFFL